MKLTDNISLKELTCKCGCGTYYNKIAYIAFELQMFRDILSEDHNVNLGIIITSACRCVKHNTKVGGAKASKHLPNTEGNAVDFYFYDKATKAQFDLEKTYKLIDEMTDGSRGLKLYKDKNFIHYDTREQEWRG